jgi:hypothetical protein
MDGQTETKDRQTDREIGREITGSSASGRTGISQKSIFVPENDIFLFEHHVQ